MKKIEKIDWVVVLAQHGSLRLRDHRTPRHSQAEKTRPRVGGTEMPQYLRHP